eukprot:TRINITY_DN67209_c5_g1_i3.p1 TRINITY_DN67209_c5_g1~~TRINITY_DN67209_c5_g1_i3.p1  ORF type:complete len:439 (+),score=40.54 TRINITY_DN67209_c5_g1_i3:90-1406(+)
MLSAPIGNRLPNFDLNYGPFKPAPQQEDDPKYDRLKAFLNACNDYQRRVDELTDMTDELEDEHHKQLVGGQEDCEETKDNIQRISVNISNLCRSLCTELAELNESTVQFKKLVQAKNAAAAHTAELRIRENTFIKLQTMLHEALEDFEEMQQDVGQLRTRRISRHLTIAGVAEENRDQVLKHAESNEDLDQLHKMVYQSTDSVQQCPAELLHKYAIEKEKRKEIYEIEDGLRELHQMFQEFSVLVNNQQSGIDQIAHNIASANEYIISGTEDLVDASNLCISSKWLGKRSKEKLQMKPIEDRTKARLKIYDIYENQRHYPIKGWGKPKLLGDPGKWSDITGKKERNKADVQLLPGWKWEGDWSIEVADTDNSGWQYAFDFKADAKWSASMHWNSYVRRKKWTRRAICDGAVATAQPTKKAAPTPDSDDEFELIDGKGA